MARHADITSAPLSCLTRKLASGPLDHTNEGNHTMNQSNANWANANWVFINGCERFKGSLSNVVRHALEKSNSKAEIHHQAGQVVQHGWYWALTINSRRLPYSVPAIVPVDVATELLLSQLGTNWADAGLAGTIEPENCKSAIHHSTPSLRLSPVVARPPTSA